MKIVFVNYGDYGNNSSNHIDGFAQGLVERGHEVGLVAGGQPLEMIPGVSYANYDGLSVGSQGRPVSEMLGDVSTLLHGWTPRENVRRWVQPLARGGRRYVVHLEDDEDIVTASQLRKSAVELKALPATDLDQLVPRHLSHPAKLRSFLAAASGITIIADALRAFVPDGVSSRLIEPGADLSLFRGGAGSTAERAARRARLGVGAHTTLLAYHGGIHPAVQRDIFSLYTAVGKLRRAGHNVALLRLGMSRDTSEVSSAFREADGVVQVPSVPRAELPGWLDLADIYIQPGAPSLFNVRRLPSKLLDFFSMGRPVILPAVYVATRCVDEKEAILLKQGGSEEIVRCVKRLLFNPGLMEHLGRRGREWVNREFLWDDKVAALENFYETLPIHVST